MLWEVKFYSTEYDNDPRMPGTIDIDRKFYIVADTYKEAVKKSKPLVDPLIKAYPGVDQEVTYNVMPVENMVACKKTPKSDRGLYSQWFTEVNLSLPEDSSKWRLEVTLVKCDE